MRTAILLTGALRTIKKTVKYFKRNLIDALPDFHTHGDVFVCVQNDTSDSEEHWNAWLQHEIRPRSIEWISREGELYRHWTTLRDKQISNMITIGPQWAQYLKNSGSCVEYFQLQCAYGALLRFEQQGNFRYDYVVRARTDSIYCKPLDFHWLTWSEEDVAARMERVRREMRMSQMAETDAELLRVFMGTILSDDVLPNLDHLFLSSHLVETETLLHQPLTAPRLLHYLHHGRYIVTLRANNLYFLRRSLFSLIPALGSFYGQFPTECLPDKEKPYSFNAENQFFLICCEAQISRHDYSSLFEEMSIELHDRWQEEKFFDLQGELINPRMLYCIVRK